MLRLTGDQRPQFRALFLGPNTHHLFSTAMEGNLPKTGLRGIAWGFFLGTLPAGMHVAGWARCAQQKRKEYDALVSEHCVDPHQAAGAEADLSICNPLSQHEESPWSSFFETEELRNEIQKDLSRLHPGYSREGEDHPFFAAASVQESMLQLSEP